MGSDQRIMGSITRTKPSNGSGVYYVTDESISYTNQYIIMPMRTTITLRRREVYGNELHYVVDSDQALALRELTGQKTLTQQSISALKRLGYTITYTY